MPLSTDNGLFIPNTEVFNTDQFGKDMTPEEIANYFYILQFLSYNNLANAINFKESGFYVPIEFVTCQQWFKQSGSSANNPFSFGWRIVINFGALPNAGTKSVAHNIKGLTAGKYSWTKIMGSATDAAGNGIPLPFSSPVLNENISLTVDITQVHITTAIDYSAFTNCYIILEYLKDSF